MFNKSSGQALAEFLVVAVTIGVPLALMTPVLGRYTDGKIKAEQAAHYNSWERTVWYAKATPLASSTNQKTDDKIRNEITARILAPAENVIVSNQGFYNADLKLDPILYVANPLTKKQMVIFKPAETGGEKHWSTVNTSTSSLNGVSSGVNAILGGLDKIGFTLPTKTLVKSQVALELQPLPWLEAFNWDDSKANEKHLLSSEYSMLTDGWNVAGAGENKKLVNKLVPLGALDSLFGGKFATFLLKTSHMVIPWLSHLSSLKWGYTDMNPVPIQRLCEYHDNKCKQG